MIAGTTGLIGASLASALLYANEERKLGLTVLAIVRDEARTRRKFAARLAKGDSMRPSRTCTRRWCGI